MKARILIPNCDGHRLENSVPFDIPILPPFGTRLRLTRETLLQMENIIYNHDDILLFLGAGSISSWAYQIFNELNNQKQ